MADGKGNAILKFEKSLNDTIRFQYVQKFDKNSNSLWGENGVVYSHYNKEIISRIERTMCRDSYGGAIVVWSEFPHDIYAQQISCYGNLGEVITTVTSKKQKNKLHHNLLLHNYPNPTNNSTLISFQLPKGGDASLKIFNLSGQVVKSLLNQKHKEGRYDITWNGNDQNNNHVSSGIYLIKLSLDQFSIIKKIALVR